MPQRDCLIRVDERAIAATSGSELLSSHNSEALSRWNTGTERRPTTRGARRGHDRTGEWAYLDLGQLHEGAYESTLLYDRAMSYDRRLDRDKDGIACEKS